MAPMEIFSAKCNALMNRAAARDLYDWNNLMEYNLFQDEKDLFRKCIIFYASISAEKINKEFSTTSIDDISFSNIRSELFPVIRDKANFDLDDRKNRSKEYIKNLMQLSKKEQEYIKCFENRDYRPDFLFEDEDIVKRLLQHPMAIWKCKNHK